MIYRPEKNKKKKKKKQITYNKIVISLHSIFYLKRVNVKSDCLFKKVNK